MELEVDTLMLNLIDLLSEKCLCSLRNVTLCSDKNRVDSHEAKQPENSTLENLNTKIFVPCMYPRKEALISPFSGVLLKIITSKFSCKRGIICPTMKI
jgi:hypothetical protein